MLAWYENTAMGRPKLAQVKETFQVRLPDDRRRALQAEAETRGGTPSEVIRLHLERYAEIVWHDLPKVSEGEWCAVFEAVGAPSNAEAIGWVGMTVARALDGTDLARKWKVSAKDLAGAARAWTFGQCCAVADAAVRFQRALSVKGTEVLAAVRQATTRPGALVLEAPARRERSSTRSHR